MNTKRITRTALLIALLVAVQYATKSFGQIVTGSCVNLILAVTAFVCDAWCASVVALISPFCAFLLGIGTPILRLVPRSRWAILRSCCSFPFAGTGEGAECSALG